MPTSVSSAALLLAVVLAIVGISAVAVVIASLALAFEVAIFVAAGMR